MIIIIRHIFLEYHINSDVHISTKMNAFTFYKGGGGGGGGSKNLKKMEAFPLRREFF